MDVMLVLSVYKGEGLRTKEGHRAVVTAHLQDHVLATDPVPMTSGPEFRQEVSWDVNTTTLHRYKCAKVPIKIECHAVDASKRQMLLGYVIMPLNSAVRGEKVEPKWYNLLGGPSSLGKTPARILLSLNILRPSGSAAGVDMEDIIMMDLDQNDERDRPQKVSHPRGIHPQLTGNIEEISPSHSIGTGGGSSYSQTNDSSSHRGTSQQVSVQSSPSVSFRENGHKSSQQNAGASSNLALDLPGTSKDNMLIIPRLGENGGFFQIGPVGEPNEGAFHFSVTVVYAKNLDQVLPKDLEMVEGDEVRFCYSLLGQIVYTDPIKDLRNPNFLAQKAAGKVCSTSSNVAMYFKQHPDLPIHLVLGDVCLATSSINLSSFESLEDSLTPDNPLTVEGTFSMVPAMINPLLWAPSKQPELGIIIQLSLSLDTEAATAHYPTMIKDNFTSGRSAVLVDYLSSASSSDEASDVEESQAIAWSSQSSMSGGRSPSDGVHNKIIRRGHRLRDVSSRWRHQRKSLMYEAAMEVETWKENQQHMFWKLWRAREAELQDHLASEWQSRITSVEAQLQQRLDQCEDLHRKITSTLVNLGVKEKSVAMREEKVKAKKKEISRLRREIKQREKMSRHMWTEETVPREMENLREQLEKAMRKRVELERQVRELEAANRAATDAAEAAQLGNQVKAQEVEAKRQELQLKAQETEALKRDKEHLSEQLSAAIKRKQYYKLQWMRSVGQVHHLQTSHMQQAHNVKLERSSPEPYFVHPRPSKWLKYKEENHTSQTERTKLSRQHSDAETNKGASERWRSMGASSSLTKNPQLQRTLEKHVTERQERERIVNKLNSIREAKDYDAAIQEAGSKIRSLTDR
ncbi:centrosomal protein of 120 kDa-like [Homarus americanus]|uniref:centrosomal protein of 120 kDa-like n=1 Tax=Homarus americanus TaxID=6706 RepID=UPI001C4669B0|nr:centrosomal protein of 120 kDa-like [Homarus americanus]